MKAKIELLVEQDDLVKILQAGNKPKIQWWPKHFSAHQLQEVNFELLSYSGPFQEPEEDQRSAPGQ